MATNNFKPFATAASANVTSQSDYEALPALLSGFSSGKASSAQVNKALRQATFIASSLAQFITNSTGQDIFDDGDQDNFLTKLEDGFAALFLSRTDPFADIKLDNSQPTARANIGLGDAAVLGVATAQQMAAGTSNNLLPSVAAVMSIFGRRAFSSADYIRIPDVSGGLIIQWGSISNGGSGTAANTTFPIAFPVSNLAVVMTGLDTSSGGFSATKASGTTTGFTAVMRDISNAAYPHVPTRLQNASYVAIGY